MINKEDELVILCLQDESKISGVVQLEHVRKVIFDYVQVGPMYRALVTHLKNQNLLPADYDSMKDPMNKRELPWKGLFEVLNSPLYLRDVSKVNTYKISNENLLVYECVWNLCKH